MVIKNAIILQLIRNVSIRFGIIALSSFPALATASILPFTIEQRLQFQNAQSGGANCTTSGSYDSNSFLWQQLHVCPQQPIFPGLGLANSIITLYEERTMLTAFVDNSGHLLGGTFSWFAAIPESGLDELTLVAFGPVLDMDTSLAGPNYFALARLDYMIDPLTGIGPVVEWGTYVFPWTDQACHDGLQSCNPWSQSRSYSFNENYTGTTFDYYDERILVPEPSTVSLLVIGLLGLLAGNRWQAFTPRQGSQSG